MRKLLLVLALPFLGSVALKCQAQGNAVIEDSGSTNFSGYRITIEPSGKMSAGPHGRIRLNPGRYPTIGTYTIPPELADRFFADLDALMPISKLPVNPCAKSRSFGTVTTITYSGQTSPDIQCVADKKLREDLAAIENAISAQKARKKLP